MRSQKPLTTLPVVLLFFCLSMPNITLAQVAPTHLLVTRIGPCYDVSSTDIVVSEMSLKQELYDATLSGTMNITKDVKAGWRIEGQMQKCNDIRNLDTCDYFKKFIIIRDGCGQSEEAEDLYIMFFHYVTPKLECPLQAGEYRITEFPVFTEDSELNAAESRISTSMFGYTYRLEGFDTDDQRIFCVDTYLKLLYIREHEWVRDTESAEQARPDRSESNSDETDDDSMAIGQTKI